MSTKTYAMTAETMRTIIVLASIGLSGAKTWAEIEATATREVVDESGRSRRLMTATQFASTVKTLMLNERITRHGRGSTALVSRTKRVF